LESSSESEMKVRDPLLPSLDVLRRWKRWTIVTVSQGTPTDRHATFTISPFPSVRLYRVHCTIDSISESDEEERHE